MIRMALFYDYYTVYYKSNLIIKNGKESLSWHDWRYHAPRLN